MIRKLQPTYSRQRFLLAIIRQLDDSVTFTDLQKLVFLYIMREGADYYEFLPYKYGAYSFQLSEDIDILRRDGFVVIEGTRLRAAGVYPKVNLFDIVTERGDNLIRKAYRMYPYYSINSEITNRLFLGTEAELFESEKQKYFKTEQTLFTIGYEGRSIEAFINLLLRTGIKLLCDVRKNPLSRKFGFSKSKLDHITGTVGIKYIHIPELGIESEKRATLDTVEDYVSLFYDYAATLPSLKQHLAQVFSLLMSYNRIALMCYERDAQMCHRHVVRDYLVSVNEIRSVDLE